MNRIILTKTIALTEFVFHLKNLSAVCTDDTHKNGRLFRGGSIYIYTLFYYMMICSCRKMRDFSIVVLVNRGGTARQKIIVQGAM